MILSHEEGAAPLFLLLYRPAGTARTAAPQLQPRLASSSAHFEIRRAGAIDGRRTQSYGSRRNFPHPPHLLYPLSAFSPLPS